MKELDEADAAESRPGALTKEDIVGVLDYLERRKAQLTEALEQMAGSGENHICTTDPESRLMKTRDGIRPSFNGKRQTIRHRIKQRRFSAAWFSAYIG